MMEIIVVIIVSRYLVMMFIQFPLNVPEQSLYLDDTNINDLSSYPSDDDESDISSPSFNDEDDSALFDNLARSIQDMSILDEGVVRSPRVTRTGRVSFVFSIRGEMLCIYLLFTSKFGATNFVGYISHAIYDVTIDIHLIFI